MNNQLHFQWPICIYQATDTMTYPVLSQKDK